MEGQNPLKPGNSSGKLQRLGRKRDPRTDSEDEQENDPNSASHDGSNKRGIYNIVC